jgi:hypothetical protein
LSKKEVKRYSEYEKVYQIQELSYTKNIRSSKWCSDISMHLWGNWKCVSKELQQAHKMPALYEHGSKLSENSWETQKISIA